MRSPAPSTAPQDRSSVPPGTQRPPVDGLNAEQADYDAYVQACVDSAPPLQPAQITTLSALFAD
jgi:hypothetical protein